MSESRPSGSLPSAKVCDFLSKKSQSIYEKYAADGGANDTGYGIYDLWDLGEFHQKGTVRTKYGDINDLLALSQKATDTGMKLYFDAVLNHKAGADRTEQCRAERVESWDRLHDAAPEQEIDAWVGFDFPGRENKYSSLKWHWYHFSGVDWDARSQQNGCIYRILGDGKSWASDVDSENGNYDFLMYADIDHRHPEVHDDMVAWGLWVSERLNLHGMRFDAVKHYSESFLLHFLDHLTANHRDDFFCVGEFWKDNVGTMIDYINRMRHQFSLFDTPLVYNISEASQTQHYDLRKIFDNSLVQHKPINAVTLVMNHDTQPGQALPAPVYEPFKPLAYALILLRQSGYPCIFYGDLYGTSGPYGGAQGPACGGQLGELILARKHFAYGQQDDYWDFPTCIGWVRHGTWDRPDGCAVVMSSSDAGYKRMWVGEMHAGEVWTDVLGWNACRAEVGSDGFATFWCCGYSVSVYVREGAKGRERLGKWKPTIAI